MKRASFLLIVLLSLGLFSVLMFGRFAIVGVNTVESQAAKIVVVTDETENDEEDFKEISVTCPEGKVVIGGGAGIFYDSSEGRDLLPVLVSSLMYPDDSTWYAEAIQPPEANTDWSLRVQAICALP